MHKLLARISADRLAALVFLCVFAAYGITGNSIPPALARDVVGPDLFPRWIAILGVVLACFLFFQGRPDDRDNAAALDFDLVALAPAGLLMVYALFLDTIGFPIASVVFLTVTFKYLGCPGWLRSLAYSVVSTAAAVVLFRYGLGLYLPPGALLPLW